MNKKVENIGVGGMLVTSTFSFSQSVFYSFKRRDRFSNVLICCLQVLSISSHPKIFGLVKG